MKQRIIFLLCGLYIQLSVLAQRGRVRPEDLMDEPDYGYSTSSDGSPVFYIVLLAIMVIGIIWFKITLNNSRNKEIREKTVFHTQNDSAAFTSAYAAIQNHNSCKRPNSYFIEENGVVSIPAYSKCTILEYVPDNHSYVKVKFEKYSEPLFIPRWYLRNSN